MWSPDPQQRQDLRPVRARTVPDVYRPDQPTWTNSLLAAERIIASQTSTTLAP